jgi:hypothetical protein
MSNVNMSRLVPRVREKTIVAATPSTARVVMTAAASDALQRRIWL